jgi:hypothetical protein
MLANGIKAGKLAKPVDCRPDRRQPASSGRSRSGLCQPAANSVEVLKCAWSIGQNARHVAAGSAAAGRGQRQLVVSSDTVDPRINVSGIDIHSGVKFRAGLSNPLRFPGKSSPPCGFGFLTHVALVRGGVQRVHDPRCSPVIRPLPVFRSCKRCVRPHRSRTTGSNSLAAGKIGDRFTCISWPDLLSSPPPTCYLRPQGASHGRQGRRDHPG